MEAAFLLQKIAEEMGIVFHHEEITVEENRQRNEYLRRYYNPETGEGSDTGDRRILRLPDAPMPVQYIPKALFDNEMMAQNSSNAGVWRGMPNDTVTTKESLPTKQEETRNSPPAGMPQKNYGGSGHGCAFGTISNFGHSALSVSKINWEPKTFHSV